MSSHILNLFEKFKTQPIEDRILEDEFKLFVRSFFSSLINNNYQQLLEAKVLPVADQNLEEYSKDFINFIEYFLKNNPAIQQHPSLLEQELLKLYNLKSQIPARDLNSNFTNLQAYLKEFFYSYKDQLEQTLWAAYLDKQKNMPLDPVNTFSKESLDAYSYQVYADPAKRLGALLFALFSNLLNDSCYVNTDGKFKLFGEEAKPGSKFGSKSLSELEGLKDHFQKQHGNPFPVASGPAPFSP